MTQDEISRLSIISKLEACEKELRGIELTNDKSRRLRWRELNKIIKHYKTILKGL